MDLQRAAQARLVELTGADEPLGALYLQPDRAVFLAKRSRIVLKVYADGDLLRRDWQAAQAARAAGVPTAEPLDFSPGPPAVLAMRQVLGQPLSSAHPRAAHEAGVLLERLHRVGALPPFTTGEATWDGHIFAWLECELASLSRLEALAASEIGRLGARFGRLRAILSSRPIALLHGDLQPDHVLVEERGEGVVAFLDFADAQPGDPLLDIVVLTRWDETLVPRILSGYAGLDDDAETRTLLAEYRLLRKLSEIPWLLERGYTEYANRNLIAIRDFHS